MLFRKIRQMKIRRVKRPLLYWITIRCLPLATCLYLLSCTSLRNGSLVDRAEQLAKECRYTEAIDTYRKHIEERLDESARPEWENPNFYLLMIVDLQLKMAKPENALRTCSEADQQGIEPALISDRYRAIATWYEERGDLADAFDVLKNYRERDPLLFDAMLDRVGRAITAREGSAGERLRK
jgi:hypothetical protein